jgi:hypothetical protein
MGGHYPAGGINLGPALTFGYIAGRDLANATNYEDEGTSARKKPPGTMAQRTNRPHRCSGPSVCIVVEMIETEDGPARRRVRGRLSLADVGGGSDTCRGQADRIPWRSIVVMPPVRVPGQLPVSWPGSPGP